MSSYFKTNHNVVYSCKDHRVGCPKYRHKVLVNGVDVRLKEIINQTAREFRATIIEMEVMPDPIHLLCEIDPPFGFHRWMRQEFLWLRTRLPARWTNSYFVAMVGSAPLAISKHNIENQKAIGNGLSNS